MNYICDYCGEKIKENKYALPYDNYSNICHIDCVEDWFEMHLQDVIYKNTVYIDEGR